MQPVVDDFAAAGTPYVGVIYAGLMLTADGPRLIEYNVRFGDPEAQAVLPLVETDLAELALAAARGDVTSVPLVTRTAVIGHRRRGRRRAIPPHPSRALRSSIRSRTTRRSTTRTTAWRSGSTPASTDRTVSPADASWRSPVSARISREARRIAYARMDAIHFDGMQVRRDIGWRAPGAALASYADAGVDIDEGTRAVAEMKAAVESTHDIGSGRGVLQGVGSFGGVFSAAAITELDDPVLVASTDGVGTKVELAARLGRVRGVGADIVNHCIDDVLVQNARPLFFLDYIAASVLDADMVADIVQGHGRRVPCRELRRARRRDRRDARRLPAGRVRHRRHAGRRRRAVDAAPPPRRRPRVTC